MEVTSGFILTEFTKVELEFEFYDTISKLKPMPLFLYVLLRV